MSNYFIDDTAYTLASVPQRIGAAMIDQVIWLVLIALAALAGGLHSSSGPVVLGLASAVILIKDAYRGQSPGKRMLGIRVIGSKSASPAGVWQSLVRNTSMMLLSFVDPLLALGPKRQRLGDVFAGTVVVKDTPELAASGKSRLGGQNKGSPLRSAARAAIGPPRQDDVKRDKVGRAIYNPSAWKKGPGRRR